MYGADSLSYFAHTTVRNAFRVVSVPVTAVQQNAGIAGITEHTDMIAGVSSSDHLHYAIAGLPKGITTFATSVATPNVLLRGCDFVEIGHLYLFKEHPGKTATRIPSSSGDIYVFVVTGGARRAGHSIVPQSFRGLVSAFAKYCVAAALRVYQRTISIPTQILSAVLKEVAVFEDDTIQCTWDENNKKYSCTTNGSLYSTDVDAVQKIGANSSVKAGAVLYAHTSDTLVVPTDKGYVIILHDIVCADDYPIVAETYSDAFNNGVTTKDLLRGVVASRGIFSKDSRTQNTEDVKLLDTHVLQDSGRLIIQTLSL